MCLVFMSLPDCAELTLFADTHVDISRLLLCRFSYLRFLFCIVRLYGSVCLSLSVSLVICQHRLTRMIPGFKKLPYEERLRQLDLWTLEERRNRADLLQVFKMYKGLPTIPFSSFFTLSTVVNTRGHTAKIAKNRCQLDIRRFFFSSRVIDRWNRLQQSVIDSGSVNSFKNGLDRTRKVMMGFFTD